MNFITHNDAGIFTNGTSLQGTLQASPAHLRAIFGAPDPRPSDVSTLFWEIQFADGEVATIYDWNSPGPLPENEPAVFRIGGFRAAAHTVVHEVFRERLRMIQGAEVNHG